LIQKSSLFSTTAAVATTDKSSEAVALNLLVNTPHQQNTSTVIHPNPDLEGKQKKACAND